MKVVHEKAWAFLVARAAAYRAQRQGDDSSAEWSKVDEALAAWGAAGCPLDRPAGPVGRAERTPVVTTEPVARSVAELDARLAEARTGAALREAAREMTIDSDWPGRTTTLYATDAGVEAVEGVPQLASDDEVALGCGTPQCGRPRGPAGEDPCTRPRGHAGPHASASSRPESPHEIDLGRVGPLRSGVTSEFTNVRMDSTPFPHGGDAPDSEAVEVARIAVHLVALHRVSIPAAVETARAILREAEWQAAGNLRSDVDPP